MGKAAKKIRVNPRLGSWNQVDQALEELGNLTRQKTNITDRYDAEIEALKTRCQSELKTILDRMEAEGNQIYLYAVTHLDQLAGRSKVLTHGVIAFHKSTELSLPKDESGVIEALKALGKEAYIKVVEKVKKLALKEEPEEVIAAVGGRLIKKDNFRIEIPEQVYEYDRKLKVVKKADPDRQEADHDE